MRDINSAELRVVIDELAQKVKDKRLDNFYDLGDGSFRFVFSGGGSVTVYLRLLKTINETKFTEEAVEATQFALALRKLVRGSRLESISQLGSDRIVIMRFTDLEAHSLVVEMFAKGNIIVTAGSSNRIVLAYKYAHYKDRKVKPGYAYASPKGEAPDFAELDADRIGDCLDAAERDEAKLITALAKRFNFGPLYLEEIIRGAGLDPNAEAGAIGKAKAELAKGVERILESIKKPDPVMYLEGGKPVDYSITKLERFAKLEQRRFNTLSELLDEVYATERGSEIDVEKERQIEELEKSAERQRELAKEAVVNAAEYRKAANAIFARMGEINMLIERVRKGADKPEDEGSGIRVKGIDKKNKVVKIEIEQD